MISPITTIALATVAGIIFFCAVLLIKEKRKHWPIYIVSLVTASVLDWAPVFLGRMDVTGEMPTLVAVHAGVTILSYVILVIAVALTLTRTKEYDRFFLPVWSVAYLLGWVVFLTR